MNNFFEIVFILVITMVLIHEMDAVRRKEWTMIIFFKNMSEELSYKVFTLFHIPMYVVILYLWHENNQIFYYIADIFLIFHAFLHYGFRNHKNNQMNNMLSKFAINSAAVFSLIHLIGLLVQ